MNIYQKLNKIQTELKAPKGQYNEYGKFKYRNCEDILEALKPLLKEMQLIIQLSDKILHIDGRFYVEATVTLYDCESDNLTSISNTAYAREEDSKKGMDGSQVTGAASSYARKYALNGLFAIDDTKDADSQDNREKGSARRVKGINMDVEETNEGIKTLSEKHLNILIKACANAKIDGNAEDFWCKRYHVDSLCDIPDSELDFMLTAMKCDKYGNYKG
jgi:hypothetical protein